MNEGVVPGQDPLLMALLERDDQMMEQIHRALKPESFGEFEDIADTIEARLGFVVVRALEELGIKEGTTPREMAATFQSDPDAAIAMTAVTVGALRFMSRGLATGQIVFEYSEEK